MLFILGKRNQTRREAAPPPALGGDIDVKSRPVRTSISSGENCRVCFYYYHSVDTNTCTVYCKNK